MALVILNTVCHALPNLDHWKKLSSRISQTYFNWRRYKHWSLQAANCFVVLLKYSLLRSTLSVWINCYVR